jgi:hypothetical protein
MVLSNSDVKLQREPITILIMIEEILRFQRSRGFKTSIYLPSRTIHNQISY